MPELAFGFVFFNPIACLVLRTGLLAYGVTKHGPCGLGHRAAMWIYKTSSATHERLFSTFRILLAYKDLLSTLCVLAEVFRHFYRHDIRLRDHAHHFFTTIQVIIRAIHTLVVIAIAIIVNCIATNFTDKPQKQASS